MGRGGSVTVLSLPFLCFSSSAWRSGVEFAGFFFLFPLFPPPRHGREELRRLENGSRRLPFSFSPPPEALPPETRPRCRKGRCASRWMAGFYPSFLFFSAVRLMMRPSRRRKGNVREPFFFFLFSSLWGMEELGARGGSPSLPFSPTCVAWTRALRAMIPVVPFPLCLFSSRISQLAEKKPTSRWKAKVFRRPLPFSFPFFSATIPGGMIEDSAGGR